MYTYFEPTRKVLCAMQVIDEDVAENTDMKPVFPHAEEEDLGDVKDTDSTSAGE